MITSMTAPISSQQAKEQQASSTVNIKTPPEDSKQLFDLIDSKFNQLAQKIIDELKEGQQSQQFCQALDAALREPLGALPTIIARQPVMRTVTTFNTTKNSTNNSTSTASKQHRPAQTVAHHDTQAKFEQPRSLPAEVRPSASLSQFSERKVAPVSQPAAKKKAPSDVFIPIVKSATVAANSQQQSLKQTKLGLFAPSITTHPLLQSVTSSSSHTKREIVPLKPKQSQDSEDDGDEDDDDDDDDDDDGDDDEDEDDDELDDREFDLYEEADHDRGSSNRRNPAHQSPVDDPKASDKHDVIKRKTPSDLNQANEQNNNNILTPKKQTYIKPQTVQQIVQKHQQRQRSLTATIINPPVQQQSAPANADQKRKRFIPIARSNTFGSGIQQPKSIQEHRTQIATGAAAATATVATTTGGQPADVKPVTLSKRDIGSLYKPHMNYSTSVSGNHRLSDDDEIIIIPTQSPSLVSNSPDLIENRDLPEEHNERFSISRTKSFWEKLAKGNPGRRFQHATSPVAAAELGSMMDAETTAIKSTGGHHQYQFQALNSNSINNNYNGGGNYNGAKTAMSRSIYTKGVKKVDPRQIANGGGGGGPLSPHNLDRMDSTGGSNSNYSCSSSGDENSGSHSQHNPVIGQIQEMSRQNRFRQTR